MMNIRPASPHDAEGIARVHVQSWQSTYRGIVSESFLSRLSVERRIEFWERVLNNPGEKTHIYVLENHQGVIHGFIFGGISREHDMTYEGELYAIYLLEEAQGRGYGKKLFAQLIQSFELESINSFVVWVIEQNPALHFYQKLGGKVIACKKLRIGEDDIIEIALGWQDLRKVISL